jgi:hypothetical protein
VLSASAATLTPLAPLAWSWVFTALVRNFAFGLTGAVLDAAAVLPVNARTQAHASSAHGLKRIVPP